MRFANEKKKETGLERIRKTAAGTTGPAKKRLDSRYRGGVFGKTPIRGPAAREKTLARICVLGFPLKWLVAATNKEKPGENGGGEENGKRKGKQRERETRGEGETKVNEKRKERE